MVLPYTWEKTEVKGQDLVLDVRRCLVDTWVSVSSSI